MEETPEYSIPWWDSRDVQEAVRTKQEEESHWENEPENAVNEELDLEQAGQAQTQAIQDVAVPSVAPGLAVEGGSDEDLRAAVLPGPPYFRPPGMAMPASGADDGRVSGWTAAALSAGHTSPLWERISRADVSPTRVAAIASAIPAFTGAELEAVVRLCTSELARRAGYGPRAL